jgi:putative ABC transport system ATP-binding protein
MNVIELRDIRKVYQLGEVEVTALRSISLDIAKGELLALVGPSGSGKSTLMNTLGCLDRPTGGSYKLAGKETVALSSDQRAEVRNQQSGFVFQSFNLLARTSAIENVELPLLYRGGMSAGQRRKRAVELLTRIGLGDRLDHHPSQLSGGQQQRVAIARALVNNPSILMCDEPTGNLDSRTSKEIIQLFRTLNRDFGITVILVTHDPDVARATRRVVVLRDGLVVEDTTDFPRAMQALHDAGLAEPEKPEEPEDSDKALPMKDE